MTKGEHHLGVKVRRLRRRSGLTQAQLAGKLGISASYLNLIENDKRPLTAPVLLSLARELEVDLDDFAPTEDARLIADLMECFGDPLFDDEPLTNQDVREMVASAPAAARSVLRMYRALRAARQGASVDGAGPAGEELPIAAGALSPSEDVSDFLQHHNNHFPDLEEAAARVWADADLTFEELYTRVVRYLDEHHGIRVEIVPGAGPVRRYDQARRTLRLSELLPPRSRNFQLAHQLGLVVFSDVLDELACGPHLEGPTSRNLCRVALANYFAAALLMPYEKFYEAAEQVRYDIELLGHRFRTSYEQVCHRLTTLRRPDMEGIPFHFVRVDVAGNISKRFSGSGIRFARYSGGCPRWNVFGAFLTPWMIRTQLSVMPDGRMYFCVARTVRTVGAGYHSPPATYAIGIGAPVEHAHRMVYADGVDTSRQEAAVPIGVTCRLCERLDCAQRAFPPLHASLEVDEDLRGASFYAPMRKLVP